MSNSLKKLQSINPENTLRHPLNRSKAKMQYTFTKSSRFRDTVQKGVPYYNLPGKLDKRTTSLGYGKKTTFQDRRGFPPPNRYDVSKEFVSSQHGISFGTSRQTTKNNAVFTQSKVPGPGAYQPIIILQKSPSFTIRQKTRDHSLDEQIKVPGPGQYKLAELINKIGRYSSSKYENSKCNIIPKATVRFKTQQVPAPNTYFPKVLNSHCDRSITESRVQFFPKSKRKGIYQSNDNPGPGQQQIKYNSATTTQSLFIDSSYFVVMIKTRKENRISASPLDLLNNIKYVKTDRKIDHNNSSNQLSFKKSQTALKRSERLDGDLLFSLDPTKKAYQQMKISTYRSPAKKNQEERKSDYNKKKQMRSLSRNDHKSIQATTVETFKDSYGRTVRFKTQQYQKQSKQTEKEVSKVTYNKNKALLDSLALSKDDSFQSMVMASKQKLSHIYSSVEKSGIVEFQFICDLITRFQDLLMCIVQKSYTQTLQRLQQHQRLAEQFYESNQQLKKENINLQSTIVRLKDENELYRTQINHYSRYAQSQRILLQDKLRKQKQMNTLVYQLRLAGVDIDEFYRKLTSFGRIKVNQLDTSNQQVEDIQNQSIQTV